MEEDANLMTREQYIEMLIDVSCWDASEMESGFRSWCERHVPTWRTQGYDETWIRRRIETAQSTRVLHRKLKEQGFTMLEILMSFVRRTQITQYSMTWRENANISTLASSLPREYG